MSSLYAQYALERSGITVLETEHGFITYIFMSDYCYIEDLFVVKEKRNTKVAYELAETVTKIAQDAGYTKLLGSVCVTARGAEHSLSRLIQYGFRLKSLEGNMIYLVKDI